jgi:hypothetical protein
MVARVLCNLEENAGVDGAMTYIVVSGEKRERLRGVTTPRRWMNQLRERIFGVLLSPRLDC